MAAMTSIQDCGLSEEQLDLFRSNLEQNTKSLTQYRYTSNFLYEFRNKLLENKQNTSTNTTTSNSAFSTQAKPQISKPRSENAWLPCRERKDNDEQKIVTLKKLNSDLNKLTVDNYITVTTRIIENIYADSIQEFVELMFDKVVLDKKYTQVFTKFCLELQTKFKENFLF